MTLSYGRGHGFRQALTQRTDRNQCIEIDCKSATQRNAAKPQPKRRAAFQAAAVAIRSLRRKEFERREFMEVLRPGRPRSENRRGWRRF
jgi:hypothetical protein